MTLFFPSFPCIFPLFYWRLGGLSPYFDIVVVTLYLLLYILYGWLEALKYNTFSRLRVDKFSVDKWTNSPFIGGQKLRWVDKFSVDK